MDIKTYAALLLVAQSVSVIFMVLILKRQVQLFKTAIQEDLVGFRRVQFGMTLGIFLFSLVFISVNVLTIMDIITRSAHKVNAVGLLYGGAISAVILLFSILTWLLYRMAAKVILMAEKSAQNKSDEGVQ